MPRGGSCAAERRPRAAERRPRAAERRPCAAERRPLCREEALCAGMFSVLGGFEEAVCREEAPVPRGGPLCW